MKKLLILVLCTLLSCGMVKNISKDQIFATAKTLTQTQLKKLFPEADFSKEKVALKGTFQMEKIRTLTKKGESFRIFLTELGKLSLEKLDFTGHITWERISEAEVVIEVFGNRKPYTPRYANSHYNKKY